ncbi:MULTISPECIES: hypothetical protein [unclassified Rhizobium]|jgi:hypothetical protein|uniref:hypothetical protein n=1 Tax=unclassified Rhizobium TaxID=2613769 RepID=UPI0006491BB8|nr:MULTISPECIES: hypothetical protein [unclassified Rhizobium]MBN8951432.1 hypothetical protein [Rhizobium tropici]OJY74754.1 MAG: hypothetical protein BGP09_33520 [Rhizobium sp. 60-20]RKD66736.1 hypothetical protein BJ928_106264 [Rhizobium sp. WW_1]
MNEFQIGTEAVAGGHLGWIRKVHRATNEILRDNRGEPIVFATQDAAKAAAGEAMVAYLNTPMLRDGARVEAISKAEAFFKLKSANAAGAAV